MRFLRNFLIGILGIMILGIIAGYIFLKNLDVNQYRPMMISQIEKLINRDTAIESIKLDFSVFGGVYLRGKGIKVHEDPAFGQGVFCQIQSVNIKIDVMAFLLRHELVLTEIVIDSPEIHFLRSQEGKFNFESLAAPTENLKTAQTSSGKANGSADTPGNASNLQFSVHSLELQNGKVYWQDAMGTPVTNIYADQIKLIVKDFSLTQPFDITVQSAFLSDSPDIEFSSRVGLDINKSIVKLSHSQLQLDVSKLSLQRLEQFSKDFANLGLSVPLEGKLILNAITLSLDAKGIMDADIQGQVQDGKVKFKALPAAIEHLQANLGIDPKNFKINTFVFDLAQGKVQGQAKVDDYQKSQKISLTVTGHGVGLEQLLPELPGQMKLAGSVKFDLTLSGSNAEGSPFLDNAKGNGQCTVENGQLENFNLLKLILGQIKIVPGLVESLEGDVPEPYREQVEKNKTVFKTVQSDFNIAHGTVTTPKTQVISDFYELELQGDLDFKQNLNVKTYFKMSKDFSEYLTNKVKPLTYLEDDSQQIEIPIKPYSGPANAFKPEPDLEAIGKKVFVSRGKEEVERVLDKVFPSSESEPQANPDPSAPAPDNKPVERKLIEGILDKILK